MPGPVPECRIEVVCKACLQSSAAPVPSSEDLAGILAWAGFECKSPGPDGEPASIDASFEVERCVECEAALEAKAQAAAAINREQWHKDAIKAAGDYVRKHPEMVDDFSDADPGL